MLTIRPSRPRGCVSECTACNRGEQVPRAESLPREADRVRISNSAIGFGKMYGGGKEGEIPRAKSGVLDFNA